jgi:hypothetical protein
VCLVFGLWEIFVNPSSRYDQYAGKYLIYAYKKYFVWYTNSIFLVSMGACMQGPSFDTKSKRARPCSHLINLFDRKIEAVLMITHIRCKAEITNDRHLSCLGQTSTMPGVYYLNKGDTICLEIKLCLKFGNRPKNGRVLCPRVVSHFGQL